MIVFVFLAIRDPVLLEMSAMSLTHLAVHVGSYDTAAHNEDWQDADEQYNKK